MGVDIYGRNPKIVGDAPVIDYDNATEEEKSKYFEELHKWEDENPGYYFRSNWWGWRPIVHMVEEACFDCGIDVETSSWQYNDATGPETQEECDKIADALERFIDNNRGDDTDENDRVNLCLGMWCTMDGTFLDKDMEAKLNEQYPIGTVYIGSIVTSDGSIVSSAHGTYYKRVKQFITFLRNCGGFQVF